MVLLTMDHGFAQSAPDSSNVVPDHWVSVDLKEWAWYLNFTRQQKQAVQAIAEKCVQKENALVGPTDYVDSDEQRARRKEVVQQGTAEVRDVLDPARFSRWLYIRNGGRPMKPVPLGSGNMRIRTGIGIF